MRWYPLSYEHVAELVAERGVEVDSAAFGAGQTIDFLLTAKRDTAPAKRFLRRAIEASGNPMPRVINVEALKDPHSGVRHDAAADHTLDGGPPANFFDTAVGEEG